MSGRFQPVNDDSLDADDDELYFDDEFDYSEDDDEEYPFESDDEEEVLEDNDDDGDDAGVAGTSDTVQEAATQPSAPEAIPAHIQKQIDDLQRARAGAQRKLAQRERELQQMQESSDLQQVQMARRVVEAQLADEDDNTRRAALAEFDSKARDYLENNRTQRQQAAQIQQGRTTAARQIVQSVGVDPHTRQPYVTEDELIHQDFQTPEEMALYAAQRAGLLDYNGNPTQKYWQYQQLQQQQAYSQQYQQPLAPYQQAQQYYPQGGQMPIQQPPAQAPQQPPAKTDARAKRAKRRKDSFPNPKTVSTPRKEPTGMDASINEFIQGFKSISRTNGRRKR